jgi:phosphohistidine phosphatase
MKRLLLLRHGKSNWSKDGQGDFERTLAEHGRKAARGIADWLLRHDLVPDYALVSEAVRTRQTWQILCEALDREIPARIENILYLASPGIVLAHIEALPTDTTTPILVGHNPGIEELARMLAGPDPDAEAMRDLLRGFPTAGLAVFDLAGDTWQTLSADGTRLAAFVRPREIEN